MGEIFHLLLQRTQVAEHRHAFVEDGAAGELQAILRQVAEGRVLRRRDAAVVERLHAAQNLQQRRFSRAVGADQPNAFVRRDEPIQVVEQEFGAEAFAGGGELNHVEASVALLLPSQDALVNRFATGKTFLRSYASG